MNVALNSLAMNVEEPLRVQEIRSGNISEALKLSYIGMESALGELLCTYIVFVHCGMLPLIDNAENMMAHNWIAPVITRDVQACINAIFKGSP